jgi:UDP-N-acetylmuramoylalanine--D-glutamate ligase
MKVLILGLGLHGGGVQSAAYFASRGDDVTITDLRNEKQLRSSIEQLTRFTSIRYVLGTHRKKDFESADLIIKNPGVPDSLELIRETTTPIINDIGYFFSHSLSECWAVTGSKGKSTTTALLAHILKSSDSRTVYTGGNMGTSPLSFLSKITEHDLALLELSSWQIHDLARERFRACTKVILTPLFADHLDRYDSMNAYAEDKLKICLSPPKQIILPSGSGYEPYMDLIQAGSFIWYDHRSKLRPGLWGLSRLEEGYQYTDEHGYTDHIENFIFDERHIPAVCAACSEHIPLKKIAEAISTFTPPSYRFEQIGIFQGITFINDSAATIPEATALSISSCSQPVHLIAGGSDKGIDPMRLKKAVERAASLHLLSGSLTDKLTPLLDREYFGPFDSMDEALDSALKKALPDQVIVLSPGAASFGLFNHEFDRGLQFTQAVYRRFRL